MLMRLDWQDPRREPPKPGRAPPGKWVTALFWVCIVFFLLTQLLLF